MFNFFNFDIQRVALATVGAIVLSTTFVGAAVAPARAVETAHVQVAQAQLSDEVRA